MAIPVRQTNKPTAQRPAARPASITKPTPQPPPQSAKRLPFQQAEVRYDSFPVVSAFNRADMDRAKELMQDCTLLSEQASEIEKALKENRAELAEIAKRNEVPGGMRWGQLVCYVAVGQTRRSFKVEKLVEHGVDLAVIDACYETSKPSDVVKVVDLSKPKGKKEKED